MISQAMRQFVAEHTGKIAGGLIGLAIGFCVLVFGFWQSLFLFFCVIAGVITGCLLDRGERLRRVLNRFWPDRN
ncbi:MAG: hypothetical protein DDT21_01166 [Syntrophomonadaceae bacterium]|nr:hypothetical protein [Bacillota bacterium]